MKRSPSSDDIRPTKRASTDLLEMPRVGKYPSRFAHLPPATLAVVPWRSGNGQSIEYKHQGRNVFAQIPAAVLVGFVNKNEVPAEGFASHMARMYLSAPRALGKVTDKTRDNQAAGIAVPTVHPDFAASEFKAFCVDLLHVLWDACVCEAALGMGVDRLLEPHALAALFPCEQVPGLTQEQALRIAKKDKALMTLLTMVTPFKTKGERFFPMHAFLRDGVLDQPDGTYPLDDAKIEAAALVLEVCFDPTEWVDGQKQDVEPLVQFYAANDRRWRHFVVGQLAESRLECGQVVVVPAATLQFGGTDARAKRVSCRVVARAFEPVAVVALAREMPDTFIEAGVQEVQYV